jgi:hypothetical protein
MVHRAFAGAALAHSTSICLNMPSFSCNTPLAACWMRQYNT